MDKNEDPNQDEYQFSDLDMMEPESEEVVEAPKVDGVSDTSPMMTLINKDTLLKVSLAVGGLIFFLLMYKFISSMVTETKTEVVASPPIIKPVAPAALVQAPVMQEKPFVEINQKILSIEQNQGSLTTDVSNLNTQVSQLSASLNDTNNKIQQLTETVNTLATQVAQQSQQLTALTVRATPAKKHAVRRHAPIARVYYYIQAVIPGRAWLVANNGRTLTVREGSPVPGYGVVRLIDPNEGRVLTSSGRNITFSQQDS